MSRRKPVVTVVHCPGKGRCDWRYDEHEKDWLCMYCGIWEKTAKRVVVKDLRHA